MSKRYRIKSPALIAAGRAHKAALSKWYRLGHTHHDPIWRAPYNERERNSVRDRVLYAAALGRKQGILPPDMSDWNARLFTIDAGTVRVEFTHQLQAYTREVTLRNLDWSPAPAIEECDHLAIAA